MAWTIEVKAAELGAALGMFRRFLKSNKSYGDALLSLNGENLRLDLGGMTQRVAATGEWPPGEARVSGGFLLQMVPQTFPNETVTVQADEARLTLASPPWVATAPATWEVSGRPGEGLPLAPTMVDKIRFGLTHSPQELERLGAKQLVASAMEEADRRLVRAAANLVELGIGVDDLRDLLRRKYGPGGQQA